MNKITSLSRGNLYNFLQQQPLSVSERDLVQALDFGRMDPRLMEITTEFIRDFWWNLNPSLVNKFAKSAKYPFMIKAPTSVIIDYCEANKIDKIQFINWVKIATIAIKDPMPQLLYIGVLPVGSSMIADELKMCISSFRKHGLISKDLPFNKGIPGTLKSRANLPHNLDDIDLFKISLVNKIKSLKDLGLSNAEIIDRTKINRVFLSKILNNKFKDISLEYLREKTKSLH